MTRSHNSQTSKPVTKSVSLCWSDLSTGGWVGCTRLKYYNYSCLYFNVIDNVICFVFLPQCLTDTGNFNPNTSHSMLVHVPFLNQFSQLLDYCICQWFDLCYSRCFSRSAITLIWAIFDQAITSVDIREWGSTLITWMRWFNRPPPMERQDKCPTGTNWTDIYEGWLLETWANFLIWRMT